jgi:P27 family predicted phage terminase small subunit
MGKRGPPPKPAALKKFQGTYRKDRAAPAPLELPPGVPTCPRHLPADARAIWQELAADEMWRIVLARADAMALEGFVQNMALARKYQRRAEREPMVKGPAGPKPNPAAAEARRHWSLVRQFAAEFGLTPSSRSRVSTEFGAPSSPAKPSDSTPLVGPGLRVVSGGSQTEAEDADE